MKVVIVVGLLVLALLVFALVLLALRSYRRMKRELDLAVTVIEKIDQMADMHRDIYQGC